MDPIARELNHVIESGNPHIMEMLSSMGKALFFPKGILSQGAEARKTGKHNLRVAFSCMEEEQIPELFDLVLKGVEDLKASAK